MILKGNKSQEAADEEVYEWLNVDHAKLIVSTKWRSGLVCVYISGHGQEILPP